MLNIYKLSSPSTFDPVAKKLIPYFFWISATLAIIGTYFALFVAPTDAQQGEAYRIIYVHVPAAWMSMVIYLALSLWSLAGLSLNSKLSFMMANALAPTGALFTFIALFTGSLWGKPMWGTWWVWDARLTSELILLFLYIGILSVHSATEDEKRADHASAVISIIGIVNIPIIYFSVRWWNTLHQAATISLTSSPKIASFMLLTLIVMTISFWSYAIAISLLRLRGIIQFRSKLPTAVI